MKRGLYWLERTRLDRFDHKPIDHKSSKNNQTDQMQLQSQQSRSKTKSKQGSSKNCFEQCLISKTTNKVYNTLCVHMCIDHRPYISVRPIVVLRKPEEARLATISIEFLSSHSISVVSFVVFPSLSAGVRLNRLAFVDQSEMERKQNVT